MEPSQFQTDHFAQSIIFVSPSYHHTGNSPDSAFHIHNFHRNQNPESYYSYLLPYLYHEVFEGPSLQRPLDFMLDFQEPQNFCTHQQQCYLASCTEFQSELLTSIRVLPEPYYRYPSQTLFLHLHHLACLQKSNCWPMQEYAEQPEVF